MYIQCTHNMSPRRRSLNSKHYTQIVSYHIWYKFKSESVWVVFGQSYFAITRKRLVHINVSSHTHTPSDMNKHIYSIRVSHIFIQHSNTNSDTHKPIYIWASSHMQLLTAWKKHSWISTKTSSNIHNHIFPAVAKAHTAYSIYIYSNQHQHLHIHDRTYANTQHTAYFIYIYTRKYMLCIICTHTVYEFESEFMLTCACVDDDTIWLWSREWCDSMWYTHVLYTHVHNIHTTIVLCLYTHTRPQRYELFSQVFCITQYSIAREWMRKFIMAMVYLLRHWWWVRIDKPHVYIHFTDIWMICKCYWHTHAVFVATAQSTIHYEWIIHSTFYMYRTNAQSTE